MTYVTFALKEKRLLSFGISMTFFSSFGQTFLISLFVPFFLEAFVISNAGFGTMYSAATLFSAFALPWLGQFIDRVPLRWYSFWVAAGLLMASLIVMISWHVSVLFIGLIFLRLSGQGLSSHTAQTAMARFYDKQRGKALSISSLGYPIGEAILPVIIASALMVIHWRVAWGVIALIIGLILMPVLYILIGRKREGIVHPQNGEGPVPSAKENYAILFNDRRFYYLIPTVLMPPFWATGLFLYQVSIAADIGWTASLIASAFIGFAITRILGSLIAGPAIDRFSARSLFPFLLIPMIIGLSFPIFFTGSWAAFAYMAFFGITFGIGGNIKSALWAELYGTSMIGTVRSLFSSFMVVSTSISPFIVGWLLDLSIPMVQLFIAAVITTTAAMLISIRIHPVFQ
jgi:MFS family permease